MSIWKDQAPAKMDATPLPHEDAAFRGYRFTKPEGRAAVESWWRSRQSQPAEVLEHAATKTSA